MKVKNVNYVLAGVCILLSFTDLILTLIGLDLGFQESNFFYADLFNDPIWLIVFPFLPILGLLLINILYSKEKSIAYALLFGFVFFNIILSYAVINNLILLT